jgi:hypothetical protein
MGGVVTVTVTGLPPEGAPATVGLVESPAVAEGLLSSCIYPKSPLPTLPHLSAGYPGHLSSHDLVSVVTPGATLEHQQYFPCRIANANLSTHVSRHAPLDWKSLITDYVTSVLSPRANDSGDRMTTHRHRTGNLYSPKSNTGSRVRPLGLVSGAM